MIFLFVSSTNKDKDSKYGETDEEDFNRIIDTYNTISTDYHRSSKTTIHSYFI